MALVTMSLWNHEAWIVRQNVARFQATGQLDARYLACDLSMNAVPVLLGSEGAMDLERTLLVREALGDRFAAERADRWFEWNLGHVRGQSAIARAGVVPITRPAKSPGACAREWPE
jgi:hypothetical protein